MGSTQVGSRSTRGRKFTAGLVMLIALMVGSAGPASAALITADTDLSTGGNFAMQDSNGVSQTVAPRSGTWNFADRDGNGTASDPVKPAGLTLGSYRVYTNNGTALSLSLNRGSIIGSGNTVGALDTRRNSTASGNITLTNVGDISIGSVLTCFDGNNADATNSGHITIGTSSTPFERTGHITIAKLDTHNGTYAGGGYRNGGSIWVYSGGDVRIQNNVTGALGSVETWSGGKSSGSITIYCDGSFAASKLDATAIGAYSSSQSAASILINGELASNGVSGTATVTGDILSRFARTDTGPGVAGGLTVSNFQGFTVGGNIWAYTRLTVSGGSGGAISIAGISGDINIAGNIDANAAFADASDGTLTLTVSAASRGSVFVGAQGVLVSRVARYVGAPVEAAAVGGFDMRTTKTVSITPGTGGRAFVEDLDYFGYASRTITCNGLVYYDPRLSTDSAGAAMTATTNIGTTGVLAPALRYYWGSDAAGNWNTSSSNWAVNKSGSTTYSSAAATLAAFDASTLTTGRTVTLTENVAASALEFQKTGASGGSFLINGANSITLGGRTTLNSRNFDLDALVRATGTTDHTVTAPIIINSLAGGLSATMDTAGYGVALNGDISQATYGKVLIKNGPGTLTLGGNNTYTGATTVNAGTLAITGANITYANTTINADGTVVLSGGGNLRDAATINYGTLTVNNAGLSGYTNHLVNTRNTNLYEGAQINFIGGTSATAEVAGWWLVPMAGTGTITLDANGGEGITALYNGVARGTGQAGGTVFVRGTDLGAGAPGAGGGNLLFSTTPNRYGSTNVVPWALAGATTTTGIADATFATYDTVKGFSTLRDEDVQYDLSTPDANVRVMNWAVDMPGGPQTINSLTLDCEAVINPSTDLLTITSGGILAKGSATIGAPVQFPTGGDATIHIHDRGTTLWMDGAISGGNSSAQLSIAGRGSVVLGGTGGTYAGTTMVHAGRLIYGADNVLDGPILLNGSGVEIASLDLAGHTDTIGALTVANNSEVGSTAATRGTLTVNANGTANVLDLQWGFVRVDLAGTADLHKTTSSNPVFLLGANTYTGITDIQIGTICLGQIDVAGTNSGTIANTSAIHIRSGGVLQVDSRVQAIARVNDSAPITMYGASSGLMLVGSNGTTAVTETVGALTLYGYNLLTPNKNASSSVTLTMASLTRGNAASILQIVPTSGTLGTNLFVRVTGTIEGHTNTTMDDGIVGGWALNNGLDFLSYTANGLVTCTESGRRAQIAGSASANNVYANVAQNTVTANTNINSVVFTSAATSLTINPGVLLNVQSGGLLATSINVTIAGGQLTASETVPWVNRTLYLMETGSATLTVNSEITGDIDVVKGYGGSLRLGGANTYTGSTTITSGTVYITAANNLGNPTDTGPASLVINGGTLVFDGTSNLTTDRRFTVDIAGATITNNSSANTMQFQGAGSLASVEYASPADIARTLTLNGTNTGENTLTPVWGNPSNGGANALTKNGVGTWVLAGQNTHTGTTSVTAGTLAYGVTDAIFTGAVTVTGWSAVLDMRAFSDTVGTFTLAQDATVTGTTGVLSSTTAFAIQDGTISAILGDAPAPNAGKGLLKSTGGVVTLTRANTYSGLTTIQDGALVASNETALGTSTVFFDPLSNGVLEVNGVNLAVSGLSSATAATTPTVQNGSAGSGTLTVNGSSSASFGGLLCDAYAGTLALVRAGTGTTTLTGENTYTGGTTVSGGVLSVGNALALGTTGTITVDGGKLAVAAGITFSRAFTLTSGMVGGNGTFAPAGGVTIGSGSYLDPGLSPGVTTFATGLNLDSGSTFTWELGAETTTQGADPAYAFDQALVTGGSLTIASAASLVLSLGSYAPTDPLNPFWAATQQWTIIDGSAIGGSDNFNQANITSDMGDPSLGSFSTANVGGNVILTWTPVPEPATLGLLALGGLSMLGAAVRRRRVA